ncbi:MAG TPA: STAS domain-containing protein [Herpetosiphonaceae bacterium]
MLFLMLNILRLMLQAAIAAVVVARSWSYRPAKLFVFYTASVSLLSTCVFLSHFTQLPLSDPAIYWLAAAYSLGQSLYLTSFLLVMSSLCLPEWWEGDRPVIRWVALPYGLITGLILLDGATPLNALLAGPEIGELSYRLALVPWARLPLIGLVTAGMLVVIGVLAAGYRRRQKLRPLLIIVGASVVLSSVLGRGLGWLGVPEASRYIELFQTLPTLLALAFAVLRGQQFEAKRVALDLALESLGEAVAVLDRKGEALYANPRAGMLGLEQGGPLRAGMERAGVAPDDIARLEALIGEAASSRDIMLAIGSPTRLISVELATVADADRQAQGTLLLARDVTEAEQRSALLSRERTRLADTVSQLQAEQLQRSELAATLQALNLPVIPVLEGVLVLPVIGSFDAERTDEFLSVLLRGIERERARLVLIDVTGMTLLDPAGAQGLLRGVRAAELLGARSVLVGVRPELAQSLVGLNAPLADLQTAATLQQAVRQELMRQV